MNFGYRYSDRDRRPHSKTQYVVINQKCMKSPMREFCLLGAVVTHRIRIIADLSFDLISKARPGGLNADTDEDSVPPSPRAEALPNS